MSPQPFHAVAALIAMILDDIAPAVLPTYRDNTRAASNPGLAAATATLDAWTRDLACSTCPVDPLTEDRLAAVLRAGFVAAASLGRVVVERRHGAIIAELELWPGHVALIEAMLELANTLDTHRGSSVGAAYGSWCDDTLATLLGLARQRAEVDARG